MNIDMEGWQFKVGIINGVGGSAYLESFSHKVLVTVSHPKEYVDYSVSEEQTRHAQATLIINSPMKVHVKTALEACILLERYAKSVIHVEAKVIEGDQNLALPLIINCAALSLMNAGIELKDTLVASRALATHQGIAVNFDHGSPSLVLGLLVNSQKIVFVKQEGLLQDYLFQQMLQACVESCNTLCKHIFENY